VKTRTIRQQVTFRASPHAVYEALADSVQHAAFTGSAAEISREVGGKFTTYDGGLSGINLELVPDRRIVQAWRADEANWPADHYSRATFVLQPVPNGTRLIFHQSGVPEEYYEDIRQGWIDYYWKPLKTYLASR
jgi:activator of HSP90 ATPase